MARATKPQVAAAVDIGSYSVHLLVAEVRGHELRVVHDESAFLGLGRRLLDTGRLGAARSTLRETIEGYVAHAGALGARTITLVGTDPLRRAADSAGAIDDIRAATGLDVVVLEHEEEAMLALIGVQGGRPLRRDLVMVDVGGGSTEVLTCGPKRPITAVGLPLGAARLSGVHIASDPPAPIELLALRAEVRAAMGAAPAFDADELVAVGGTARSLLRVGAPSPNRVISARRVRRALEVIATTDAASIAERFNVRLSRARVLAAGATILAAALEHYDLSRLRVGAGGLREGVILAAHRAGPAWRRDLAELARGWSRKALGARRRGLRRSGPGPPATAFARMPPRGRSSRPSAWRRGAGRPSRLGRPRMPRWRRVARR
jgi:exopolyphosphatase / guanosine-5'-triphosphate,3'-diphosphate pyrophosphatase